MYVDIGWYNGININENTYYLLHKQKYELHQICFLPR